LFESGKKKVYYKVREAFKIRNLIPTVKYGGGKSLFWGSSGVKKFEFIHDTMNQHM